jgi:hypothetical protein
MAKGVLLEGRLKILLELNFAQATGWLLGTTREADDKETAP